MDGIRKKKPTRSAYRWLISQAGSSRRWISVSIGAGYAGGLLLILQAYLLAGIIHGAYIEKKPLETFWPMIGTLIVVILLRALTGWGREVSGFMTGAVVRHEIRQAFVAHLFSLGPAHQSEQQSGALAASAVEQVEALHDFFAFYLPQLALAAAIPISIAATVFLTSWAVGGLLVVTAPLVPLFMFLVGMGAESISQRHFQSLSRLSAHFLDTLQGLATLKVYGRSRHEATAIRKNSADYRRRTMSVLRVAFLSSAVLEFFSMVSIALVAVYLGLSYLGYMDFGSYGKPLTLAGGLFILVLAPEFYLPLRELGTHYHARAKALGAAEEILKIMKVQPQAKFSRHRKSRPPEKMNISCRDLHLSFDGGRRTALRGATLEVGDGQHIAVVGASGCGKTTLLRLILGFLVPDAGNVRVDHISLADMDPERWRRRISWLGQQPYLFHGTIRENICLANPQATERDIRQAAASAHVLSFTRDLPEGLDTLVGEQGFGLSRGQAQRVALARAILKKAPLLLLDEPTRGLDRSSEALILKGIEHLEKDRTVVMVTHRLTHVAKFDCIYVMQAGNVIERGTYRELIHREGLFHRMVLPNIT
jgi:ATP-binding cassette subfamily C protein CydD